MLATHLLRVWVRVRVRVGVRARARARVRVSHARRVAVVVEGERVKLQLGEQRCTQRLVGGTTTTTTISGDVHADREGLREHDGHHGRGGARAGQL